MQLLDSEPTDELYSLLSIDYLEQATVLPEADEQRLMVVALGQGRLIVDHFEISAATGGCYLIAPGSIAVLDGLPGEKLGVYILAFHVYKANGRQAHLKNTDCFDGRIMLAARPFARLLSLIQDMIRQKANGGNAGSMRCTILFYELMAFLLEQNTRGSQPEDAKESVKRTIVFMQEHYREKLTVQELAHLAGVAMWQYRPIFQSLTGRTPLDYLTEIRIGRAKELLLYSEETVEEIASSVGFSDPYYFTRRFRQKTGLAPRQFAIRQNHKPTDRLFRDAFGQVVFLPKACSRIVYYDGQTFGDLFALGVTAIGGSHWLFNGFLRGEQLAHAADIGFPLDPAIVQSLEPDLIIIANYIGVPLEQLNVIAPTVVLDRNKELGARLKILGELLGKEPEAEQWLLRYEAQAEYMWTLCAPMLQAGESASVFTLAYGGKLYAMLSQGLPSTLYHPLGFRVPDSISRLMDKNEPFACIPEEEVSRYAGDRIFIALPSQHKDPAAYEAGLRLLRSPFWNELPAVRAGRCHVIEAHWNSGDAITRLELLRVLPDMLGSSKL